MKISRFGIVLIFISLSSFLFSQTQNELQITLDQAIQLAVTQNAEIKNASLNIDKAKKKVWETTAIGLPHIDASVAYQYNPNPAVMTMPGIGDITMGEENTATADITASQLIFSGEYIVGLQASKAYKNFASLEFAKTKEDVKKNVSSLYYNCLLAKETCQFLDSTLSTTTTIRMQTEAYNKQGFIDITSVDQVILMESKLKSTLTFLKNNEKNALDMLKYTIGLSKDSTIRLTQTLEELVEQINFGEYFSDSNFNAENTTEGQMLQSSIDLNELSAKRTFSTNLPSISAFYRHRFYLSEEPEINFEPIDLVGISASIPIFASGMRVSQWQQAKIDVMEAENTKYYSINMMNVNYQNQLNTFVDSYNQYLTTKENLALSKRIFENTQIKFKTGNASSMELNQALSQYFETKTQFLNTINTLLVSKTGLDKSLGKL